MGSVRRDGDAVGIPYLFIKLAVDDGVPPIFLAWSRIVLAAVVLLGLAWRAGTLGSVAGAWRWIAIFAVVEISLPFPLIAYGEQHVDSSLAAIIIAAAPLIVALLAFLVAPSERVSRGRSVGLVLGFARRRDAHGPGRHRQLRRAARRPGHPLRRGGLRGRPDDHAAATRWDRRARRHGREPRDRRGPPHAVRDPRPARCPADGYRVGVDRGARPALHRAGVPRLQRPRGRRRPRAGDRHHLRGARRGARTGRRGARRAPGTRCDRGAPADPRRLVDLDRRAHAARARGDARATPPSDRTPRPIGPPRGGPQVWPVGPLEGPRPSTMLPLCSPPAQCSGSVPCRSHSARRRRSSSPQPLRPPPRDRGARQPWSATKGRWLRRRGRRRSSRPRGV